MKKLNWLLVIILLVGIVAAILFLSRKNIADNQYQKALNFYDSTDYVLAKETFTKALIWDKSNDSIRFDLARTFYKLQEYKACDSLCQVILKSNSEFASVYVTNAQVCLKQNNYDRAINLLNKAIAIDSLMAHAFHFRGIAYANKGEFEKAIRDYEKAQDLSKNNISSYLNSVTARTSLEDYSGAIADYDKILELDIKHTEAWYMRGFFKLKTDDLESAITDLSKAIELNDTMGKAYYYRGLAYAKLNNIDAAYADFSKSHRLQFKADASLFNLAKTSFSKGDFSSSEKQLNKLLDKFPESNARINAYKQLASIGMSTNNMRKTNRYLNAAIEEFPDYPNFYFYRAITLERDKQYTEAIKDLNHCLKLGFNTDEVYTALAVQHISLSEFKEGCEYLHTALEKGSPTAQKLIKQYCKDFTSSL